MKLLHIAYVFCSIIMFFGCKTDSGIVVPAELPDFSDIYKLEGDVEILSNPVEKIPFKWIVTESDQGMGYRIGVGAGYNSTADRWTIGEIYHYYRGDGQFRFILYGGPSQGSASDYWTIGALDSIFRPGNQLSFGKNFGQIGIEFIPGNPVGEYWSIGVNNTDYKVNIEEVNDLTTELPEYKWAKQVVVSFNVNLKRVWVYNTPNILVKNCRASLLFLPNVE